MNNNSTLKELNNAGTSNNQQKIREDLVSAAKQFINNPRVKNTPIEEQKAFLRKKGLTDIEINEAMKGQNGQQQVNQFYGQPPPTAVNNKILEWAKALIIIGSTSFIFYRFVRSWVFPKLLGIPNPEDERLQKVEQQIESITETNKAIVESVKQTIGTICEQNEQINRTLLIIQSQTRNNNNENKVSSTDSNRLISEIGIIKSLLLSQNQFPPIPEHSLIDPKINLPQQNGLNNLKILKENNLEIEDNQEDEEYQDLDKSSGSQV
ncbi:hypothetical protein ACQ4LE_008171 [Meloidogyne hapla]|uniref:Peroxisomal membrane protein PEX14 n=1 Tax=Meloidogyne hapla TaxID=6305 RepID=A0A1I8BUZ2_MELHA